MKTALRNILFACLAAAVVAAIPARGGDASRGKDLFGRRCTGCHDLDRDKEGPRLRGVYGRTAGKVATFEYSDALKTAHFTWNAELLNRWLTNTEDVVKNNNMAFSVPNADERADIIAFLHSLPPPQGQ